jgi:integrase
MQIFNPSGMPVRFSPKGSAAMMLTETIVTAEMISEPPYPHRRATLADFEIQPPGSPARFQFPQKDDTRTTQTDSDFIAGIVAKALAIAQSAKPAEAEPVITFSDFLESVILPGVQKKTERDARTLATRRLLERVGFCGVCKISWRLDQTADDNCPRCRDTRTKYPGIDLVDSAALAWLAASLCDDEAGEDTTGNSPATAAKHIRYLMTVLNAATERGITRKIKRPRIAKTESIIRILSEPELVALYAAAENASWPHHSQFSAADFWRTFIVFEIAYGLRLGEATCFQWMENTAAKSRKLAAGVYSAPECPRRELRHLELTSPAGWIVYLPSKQAAAKPLSLVLPVPELVARHLATIRGERKYVFDVYADLKTNEAGDYRNVKVSFYRQWYALCEAAGVESDLRATPHDLRRTQETRYDLQFGKGTGGEVNGHAARSVSEQYYSQAVPRIHRAVSAYAFPVFPVPATIHSSMEHSVES